MQKCRLCESSRLIPDVRIVDHGHGNARLDLTVEIHENPDAIIFKGRHAGALQATICADCGHAELRVTNAQELYETYQRSRSSSS